MNAASYLYSWSAAAATHLDLFGSLGLILGFTAGVMPRRTWILAASAACAACFGAHYLTLGALTGTAMCAISVLQSLVSLRCVGAPGRSGWVPPVFAASTLAAACLTVATWNGWPSACAATGSLLATGARLQAAPQTMRQLFLGASLCWAGHNLLVGSVFGLTCDVLTIFGLAIALLRAVPVPPMEPVAPDCARA
ncbi:YgjV family protein [Methylobacterium sp. NMS14P]|uniref:YgjV family protein n=1 Tax=unclassified Methylobacterium TaxID=2615210 RepID=UPI0023591167|nr:YgjV family protein [Methylobacterium sp. NMS14P]WCS24609.1 YgjV family protein [Methylobacterium sp. NMS14P]